MGELDEPMAFAVAKDGRVYDVFRNEKATPNQPLLTFGSMPLLTG